MNEFECIEKIAKIFGHPPRPNIGIGDDAALLRPKRNCDAVWTTDTQVEGIHFRKIWMHPREIGRRAATATLSDIAAMGALPAYALVSFQIPRDRVNDAIDIARGIKERFSEFNTTVVGGNISRSPTVAIDLSVIGWVEKGKALLRNGVLPGDDIYVTGFPGKGALALALLKQFGSNAKRERVVRQWFNASPRIEWGRKLISLATAAIDVSDGLLADAKHLAKASRVNLELDVTSLVTNSRLEKMAKKVNRSPVELVSSPSDDYELLFSAPPSARKEILRPLHGERATWIGQATTGTGKLKVSASGTKVNIENNGWDHLVNND